MLLCKGYSPGQVYLKTIKGLMNGSEADLLLEWTVFWEALSQENAPHQSV